jgi:hypothetical protein
MTSNIVPRPTDRRALRIRDFCDAYRISRAGAYALIARGELRARKSGRRTLIPIVEAERWLASLPLIQARNQPHGKSVMRE